MIDIDLINEVAVEAGKNILEAYSKHQNIRIKDNNTPVTDTDLAANDIICNYLQKYYPEIPILSEEGEIADYSIRKNWDYYFCVDPLDGTREYIRKTGQFSVNIALIKANKAVAGVVYAPVTGVSHFTSGDKILYRKEVNEKKEIIKPKLKNKEITIVQSNFDQNNYDDFLGISIKEKLRLGSSLKFCSIAEGKANLYIKYGTTMEWDTAAGQALVEAVGGKVVFINNQSLSLTYNKENLENPDFLCLCGIRGL